ncbi:MAG: hypothetical protein ACLGI5_17745 [Thermoleophilia bacterium]
MPPPDMDTDALATSGDGVRAGTAVAAARAELVHQRGPSDCKRAVVASYLGVSYESTPVISGLEDSATFWSDWSRWLRRRGYTIATYDFAPGHLNRWIAVVGRGYGAPLHAVLMSGTELFHDPMLGPDRLTRVDRGDVMCAIVLGPLAATDWSDEITRQIAVMVSHGSPLVWCLERLMDSQWGVGMYRLRGQLHEAAAMERRLGCG